MLKEQAKKITLTGKSVITVTDGDDTRDIAVEGYTCTIDSGKPENMNVSRYFASNEGRELYKDNRSECRADYAAFEDAAYALQDEMIAEKSAE